MQKGSVSPLNHIRNDQMLTATQCLEHSKDLELLASDCSNMAVRADILQTAGYWKRLSTAALYQDVFAPMQD